MRYIETDMDMKSLGQLLPCLDRLENQIPTPSSAFVPSVWCLDQVDDCISLFPSAIVLSYSRNRSCKGNGTQVHMGKGPGSQFGTQFGTCVCVRMQATDCIEDRL